jgi:hypothetical protein
MADQYSRTRLLLGQDGIEKLRNARIALFGLGGVGGYAAEALARAGVGHMDLIDDDTISLTNLNRQILATHSSIGKYKVLKLDEMTMPHDFTQYVIGGKPYPVVPMYDTANSIAVESSESFKGQTVEFK